MSFLSKSCVYGLRAAVYVATHQEQERFVSIREISDKLDISFHFLTKILQQLTQSGILNSYRGPNGGVALARAAGEVSVKDVVDSIDGGDVFEACVLGLGGCGEKGPCPLHASWSKERAKIKRLFERTNLQVLARQVRDKKMRLVD